MLKAGLPRNSGWRSRCAKREGVQESVAAGLGHDGCVGIDQELEGWRVDGAG